MKKTSLDWVLTIALSPIMAMGVILFCRDADPHSLSTFIHELGHWILFFGLATIEYNTTVGEWFGIFPEFGSLLSFNAFFLAIGMLGARFFKPLSVFGLVGSWYLMMEVLATGQFDGDKSASWFQPLWPLAAIIATALVWAAIISGALYGRAVKSTFKLIFWFSPRKGWRWLMERASGRFNGRRDAPQGKSER